MADVPTGGFFSDDIREIIGMGILNMPAGQTARKTARFSDRVGGAVR